ncbi:hypothetical protein MBLNU230_g1614t1 [Neophaeotheca triangularis]
MSSNIHPFLTEPDNLVLRTLFRHIDAADSKPSQASLNDNDRDTDKDKDETKGLSVAEVELSSDDETYGGSSSVEGNEKPHVIEKSDDQDAIERLLAINNASHQDFQPTVFTGWDEKDLPQWLNRYVVQPYVAVAKNIVRRPTDVVFLTHILLYFATSVPSAAYLYYNFTWVHGILHSIWSVYCCGPFTLMLHNHIHNNGVLAKEYSTFDKAFPYILEPLYGHTWDSYYYHHVKHHHVEGNGPDDLSSTIRYQRDSPYHFLCYFTRFLLLCWAELPLYFLRKNKPNLALRALALELTSYLLHATILLHHPRPALFTLTIPFLLMRLGLMVGNWGQHALVDDVDPSSDFRSSITLIDVPSNRFCFNDGYHTAHHLNPLRHWRDHPVHFLQQKDAYIQGRALVFHNVDYLFITVKLLCKDYEGLAECLVPISDEQVAMSLPQRADMLRTKTTAFTEADIGRKFK